MEENLTNLITNSSKKIEQPLIKKVLLGIIAGMFIALAACGSNVIGHSITNVGLAKFISGIVFSAGLVMVILIGANLFTGSTLNVVTAYDKKKAWLEVLKDLLIVFLANMLGAFIIALLVHFSNQLNMSNGELLNYSVKVAVNKVNLSFGAALASGILCNLLVATAVLLSTFSKDIISKIMSIFFPILLFITCGFEHSVANMYFIPIGLLSKDSVNGVIANIDSLNVFGYLFNNLLPVMLGNLIAGFFLAYLYYHTKKK